MDAAFREQGLYRFGAFRLDPIARTLMRDDVPVKLQARQFDALLYLVQHHERVVERDELITAVWRGRTVDGNNLGQAIAGLRRAMQAPGREESWIVTAQRGYRIAVPVSFRPFEPDAPEPPKLYDEAHKPGQRGVSFRRAVPFAGVLFTTLCLWSVWGPGRRAETFSPPARSIAVLAFTNMTGDPAQAYFSDGLAEELTGALARLPALKVAARSSAFTFRYKPQPVSEIARQLNVGSVLEGSVRGGGARVRIAVRLVDAATGYEIWAQDYDRDRGEVLTVEKDIAVAVTTALRVPLMGDEIAKLALGGTQDETAFDSYLRGMQVARDGSPADARKSIASFDAAISRDPGFARAHVQRAFELMVMAIAADTVDLAWVRATQNDAMRAARRAVALAPDLAVAHAVLGRIAETGYFDLATARAEFAQALQLAPDDAEVNIQAATLELYLGHLAAAVSYAQRAAALNGLAPQAYRDLAEIPAAARRFDEARNALAHAMSLEPSPSPQDLTIRANIELGQHEYEAARRTCSAAADWTQLECLAIANHALGRFKEAEADLSKLRDLLGDTGAMQYAEIAAQWGLMQEAGHQLQQAYRLRDAGLLELRVDGFIDPLRGTDDYKAIESTLQFPS